MKTKLDACEETITQLREIIAEKRKVIDEKDKRIEELESCLSKIMVELEGGYLKGPDKSIEYARKALKKS